MKKRIVSFLLALALVLGALPALPANAAQGGRFVLTAATESSVIIAPCYVDYEAGQTIAEALAASGHSFTGLDQGWVTQIDGVDGNFNRTDNTGSFSLERSAAEITAFAFTGIDMETVTAADYCAMTAEMAAYLARTDGVQSYPAAQTAYENARMGLFSGTADHAALGAALRSAVAEFDRTVVGGTTYPVALGVQNLDGAAISAYTLTLSDVYGRQFSFAAGQSISLPAGEFSFTLTGGAAGARGTLTVLAGGSVQIAGKTCTALRIPAGKAWISTPVLHSETGGDAVTDAYPAQAGEESGVWEIPDTAQPRGDIYLYVSPGSDISRDTGAEYNYTNVRVYAVYTDYKGEKSEKIKNWESRYAALTDLFEAGAAGNTVTLEARCEADGYTQFRQYEMELVRTPTLAGLQVLADGTAQELAFAPEQTSYTCRVTASRVRILPEAFLPDCGITVNGEAVSADGAELDLTKQSRAEIGLTLPNGRSTVYTVTFETVAAVQVTVSHAQGVQVRIFNAAGAEYGAGEDGSYALIPGQSYTCIATSGEFYHTKTTFTASAGLRVQAASPVEEDWLSALRLGPSNRPVDEYLKASEFSPDKHRYEIAADDVYNVIYIWGSESASTLTVAETGQTVNRPLSGYGTQITNFLKTGSTGQTLTVRASRTQNGTEYYQDYYITVHRRLTLRDLTLTVDGAAAELYQIEDGQSTDWSGFDEEILEYEVRTLRSAETAALTVAPTGADYSLDIDGTEYTLGYDAETGARLETVTAETALDSAQGEQTVSILVSSGDAGSIAQTYQVHFRKKDAVATTVRVTDTAGSVLPGALAVIYDVRSGQRVWPDENGLYQLVEDMQYRYTATCLGYVGRETAFLAGDGNGTLEIRLEKAPVRTDDGSVSSSWPYYRGSADANGVVDVKTPSDAGHAMLSWATKLGSGYSSSAVSCPILITEDGYDYLVVYARNKIYKVDALSGVTVAEGTMDRASSFAINSPTYAEGMLFVGLSNGGVQAFDAKTLEPLWLYNDARGGQPNCPITYADGYLYTGFWNSETAEANYVCLSVTDEDPESSSETKLPHWTYSSKGGFYWAGSYVGDGFLLVGTDDGQNGYLSETASLLSLDPATGAVLDRIDGLRGDIRSNVSYADGRYYFTSKGGYLYSVQMDGTRFLEGSLKKVWLSKDSDRDPDLPPMSTSTPVVLGKRAYVGVSGTAQFGAYSGHGIAVIDLSSWSLAYVVPTKGYPQTSGLLTKAYGEYNYVYFIDNFTPGTVRVLQDKPGMTKPLTTTMETWQSGGTTQSVEAAEVLFTPAKDQMQYAICSPITDGYGTLYFKNDSAYLMALSNTIKAFTVKKGPDKTVYAAGEAFDPSGMEIEVTYDNGLTRTLPGSRTVNGVKIDYVKTLTQTLTEEMSGETAVFFAPTLYQDSVEEDGTREVGVEYHSPAQMVSITVGPAAEKHAPEVTDEAPESAEVTAGGLYQLKLSEVFRDAEGHTLQYTLEPHNYGSKVYVKNGMLMFTVREAGEYRVTVTASCSGGSTKWTLPVTVKPAPEGSENQYGYDETPADSVTVRVTISNDGIPIYGNDSAQTLLAGLEVTVPYFDLSNYGLEDFYRYGTKDGKGAYVNETLVRRPTTLHLYLYLLERYYMGIPEKDCGTGKSGVLEDSEGRTVRDLLENLAGDDVNFNGSKQALKISGGSTSLYMENFWGHDENLMYYRNHVYPLMSAGWGATADYMLLSDGDTIDLGMFTNWEFYHKGAFCRFDQDDYTVTAGTSLKFRTEKYGTQSVAEGGLEEFEPATGLTVMVFDENWDLSEAQMLSSSDGSSYHYTFAEPGTYYLIAMDESAGSKDACNAPAVAKVVVRAKDEAGLGTLEYQVQSGLFTASCRLTAGDAVYAAAYDADGRFLGCVRSEAAADGVQALRLSLSGGAKTVKVFRTGSDGRPLEAAREIALP